MHSSSVRGVSLMTSKGGSASKRRPSSSSSGDQPGLSSFFSKKSSVSSSSVAAAADRHATDTADAAVSTHDDDTHSNRKKRSAQSLVTHDDDVASPSSKKRLRLESSAASTSAPRGQPEQEEDAHLRTSLNLRMPDSGGHTSRDTTAAPSTTLPALSDDIRAAIFGDDDDDESPDQSSMTRQTPATQVASKRISATPARARPSHSPRADDTNAGVSASVAAVAATASTPLRSSPRTSVAAARRPTPSSSSLGLDHNPTPRAQPASSARKSLSLAPPRPASSSTIVGDPALLLTHLFSSREFQELHTGNFSVKIGILLDLLHSPMIDCWSTETLVHLYLQSQMAWLFVEPPKDAVRTMPHLPILPPFDPELTQRPWSTNEVSGIVHLLRTITNKVQECIAAPHTKSTSLRREDSTSSVTADDDDAPTTKKAPRASTSPSPLPPLFNQTTINRLQVIVQLFITRFSQAAYWGSQVPNQSISDAATASASFMPPATLVTQCHQSYFDACAHLLHVCFDAMPIAEVPLKKQLRECLLQVATYESGIRWATRKRVEEHRRAQSAIDERKSADRSDDASRTTSTSASPLLLSSISCCCQCRHRRCQSATVFASLSLPYPSLSQPARTALSLFSHLALRDGVTNDSYPALRDLLNSQSLTASKPVQLAVLAHVKPAALRVACIALVLLSTFKSLNDNDIFFRAGSGVAPASLGTESHRASLSHGTLALHFEWVEHVLSVASTAYHRSVESERSRFSRLEREARFAVDNGAWGSRPIKKTRGTAANMADQSIHTALAKQRLAGVTSMAPVAPTPSPASRQALETANATAAAHFRETQQHFAHLVAMIGAATAQQMHEHIAMHHPPSSAGRTESPSAASSAPRREQSDICIPDSQPSQASNDATMVGEDEHKSSVKPAEVARGDDPDTDDAPTNTSPSKRSRAKKGAAAPPQPCRCEFNEHNPCEEMRERYGRVHQTLHRLQSDIQLL